MKSFLALIAAIAAAWGALRLCACTTSYSPSPGVTVREELTRIVVSGPPGTGAKAIVPIHGGILHPWSDTTVIDLPEQGK